MQIPTADSQSAVGIFVSVALQNCSATNGQMPFDVRGVGIIEKPDEQGSEGG